MKLQGHPQSQLQLWIYSASKFHFVLTANRASDQLAVRSPNIRCCHYGHLVLHSRRDWKVCQVRGGAGGTQPGSDESPGPRKCGPTPNCHFAELLRSQVQRTYNTVFGHDLPKQFANCIRYHDVRLTHVAPRFHIRVTGHEGTVPAYTVRIALAVELGARLTLDGLMLQVVQ